jgi:hypothetical protein
MPILTTYRENAKFWMSVFYDWQEQGQAAMRGLNPTSLCFASENNEGKIGSLYFSSKRNIINRIRLIHTHGPTVTNYDFEEKVVIYRSFGNSAEMNILNIPPNQIINMRQSGLRLPNRNGWKMQEWKIDAATYFHTSRGLPAPPPTSLTQKHIELLYAIATFPWKNENAPYFKLLLQKSSQESGLELRLELGQEVAAARRRYASHKNDNDVINIKNLMLNFANDKILSLRMN